MLTFYYRLASILRPLQTLWFGLAIICLGWLVYLLLRAPVEVSQRWQLTALVSFAFLLNMMLLTLLFATPITAVAPTAFWPRLQYRLRYLLHYCLAWVVTVLFLLILWLFLRITLGIIVPLLL
ncbi:hypothetical protein WG68_16550 [Arsukibacterium ikkense]|uniref:Uncharacterized protein n=1 Tax=Arsukibacterium ikkense TaxID=336831 RepID=A0A0M2V0Z2_9GAMM|nr:hypothetical protein [Arsukibacterium ikkense]KKO44246.1 hypothetical protein WG68_16550 [Arsukibacterium ikkense]